MEFRWHIEERGRGIGAEEYGGELEIDDILLPSHHATEWVVEDIRAALGSSDWRAAFWLTFAGLALCFLAVFVAGMVRGEVSFRTFVDLLIGFGSGILGREIWVRKKSET